MKSLELEIVGLPKLPNELLGRHWRSRARHKDIWFAKVQLAAINKGIGPAFKTPSSDSPPRLTLIRMSAKQPDYDGLVGSFKAIIDSLVDLKILPGDSPKEIGTPSYIWEYSKRGAGRIKVKVEFGAPQ